MVSVRWLSQLNVESLHLLGSPPLPLNPCNLLFSLTATAADVEVKRTLERSKNWIRRETPLSARYWVIIWGQNFVRSRRLSAVIVRDTQKSFWYLDWHSGGRWHWILQDEGGVWVTVQTLFMTLTSEWLFRVIFSPIFLSTVSSRKQSDWALNLDTEPRTFCQRFSRSLNTGRCDDAQLCSIAMEAHAFKELRLTLQKIHRRNSHFAGPGIPWVDKYSNTVQLTASTHREAIHELWKTATYCSIKYPSI